MDLRTEEVHVDTASLLLNLLLFETCVIQSHFLGELPRMLELFDYRGLMDLLTSEGLQLQPTRALPANVDGSQVMLRLDQTSAVSRPGAFFLTVVGIGDQEEEIRSRFLPVVDQLAGLSANRRNRLYDALDRAIPRIDDEDLRNSATAQTHLDLDRDPQDLTEAVRQELTDAHQRHPEPGVIDLRIHRESEVGIFVESNLSSQLGLSDHDAHLVVGNALLALTRLNTRLGFMRAHGAVSGMREEELPFWNRKTDFLLGGVLPDKPVEAFHRVVECAGLPNIAVAVEQGAFDVDRLLEVRRSEECRQLRTWLRSADAEPDAAGFQDLTHRIGAALNAPLGRRLRFAVVNGIGAVPGVGWLPSVALGAIDTFLLDRLFPSSGPATFLSHLYPSMFEGGRYREDD